jgi:hypothetical protein
VDFKNNMLINTTIDNGYNLLVFYADSASLDIANEMIINSTLDDAHYIASVKKVTVNNYTVMSSKGTGIITYTSGLIRVSAASNVII